MTFNDGFESVYRLISEWGDCMYYLGMFFGIVGILGILFIVFCIICCIFYYFLMFLIYITKRS